MALIMAIASMIIVLAGVATAKRMLRDISGGSRFKRVLIYAYTALGLWALVYYLTCVIYAGIRLSWAWIWLLVVFFCFLRVRILLAELRGTERIKIPTWLRWTYRILYIAALVIFITGEAKIINAMTATPQPGLDYVIVLGAGVRGRIPTNPLRSRIIRAAEYMTENPETILIASGGQGPDEEISEAACIKEQLVDVYGIDAGRIILEERSTNTEENLRYSLEIIGDSATSCGIITNGFHEYRAMLLADDAGYENACSVPAATLLPVGIHYVVREFFGIIQFQLTH